MENNTIQKTYRINRKDISYLKFLLESYEGIAVSRTLDDRIALVELMIAPGFYQTFSNLVDDIADEIGMTQVFNSHVTGESHDPNEDNQSPA